MNTFSIIIPTLNEAENIEPLISRIADVSKVFNLKPEILFVDDGSTDATRQLISDYSGPLMVSLLQRDTEKGLGGAVVAGAKAARYDNLVIMDCDLSHPPESLPEIIRPLLTEQYDMVIGSRYCPGSKITGWPLLRKLGSHFASLPAHFITGLNDPLSGYFGIRKEILTSFDETMKGFKIVFEIITKYSRRLAIKEIPIHFTDRINGTSKMSLAVFRLYLLQLFHCVSFQFGKGNLLRTTSIGIFGALLDCLLFQWLLEGHVSIATAHIVSFLFTAHLLYLFGIQKVSSVPVDTCNNIFTRTYTHLCLTFLPVLFLRGGMLAILMQTGLPYSLTALYLGATTMISWFLFAGTLDPQKCQNPNTAGLRILIIIAYTLILRFLYLGTTELIQEEAYYWNYAQHLAPGYLDHPPVVALLIWFTTHLAGNTEIGIRIGSYICWFITALYSYKLTKRMYNPPSAIYSVLLISVLPIFFGAALVMTPDAPLLACWSALLYYLYRTLLEDHSQSWIGVGITLGIGLSSKYTIVLLVPAILFYLLVYERCRRHLKTPMPYIALFLTLVLFSPVIWWNIHNNWASFLFQSQERIEELPMFTTHILIGSVLLLLTPAGVATALLALIPWDIPLLRKKFTAYRQSRPYFFTLLMTLVPFLVFFFFSLSKEVKLNWTGPIWLATVPFMAFALHRFQNPEKSHTKLVRFFSAGWSKTLISLIFIYGAGLHYLSLGLPGIPYPTNTILLGWDDLAEKLELTALKEETTGGSRPILVGMDKYRIASGISFYSGNTMTGESEDQLPTITGRHLFGLDSLMFKYWHPSILFSHRDLLVISQSKGWLHPDYFKGRAMNIGTIKEFSIEKNGREISKYYYRLVSGYIPSNEDRIVTTDW